MKKVSILLGFGLFMNMASVYGMNNSSIARAEQNAQKEELDMQKVCFASCYADAMKLCDSVSDHPKNRSLCKAVFRDLKQSCESKENVFKQNLKSKLQRTNLDS